MSDMWKIISVLCACIFLLMAGCMRPRLPLVELVTEAGSILIEVDTVRAPVTAANFLRHVSEGTYGSGMFYRVVHPNNQPASPVKIAVLQGGLFRDSLINNFPVIIHETTQATGIHHLNGVISMARNEPGTASTEFFICVGDQPELDFGGKRNPDGQGFAAFGRVVRGMETVIRLHQRPDSGQFLITPVSVQSVKFVN
jgi:peptidyl-prolyl cis-trans isomerase A (cyclophilin A)